MKQPKHGLNTGKDNNKYLLSSLLTFSIVYDSVRGSEYDISGLSYTIMHSRIMPQIFFIFVGIAVFGSKRSPELARLLRRI
jgi:hypothetical protein